MCRRTQFFLVKETKQLEKELIYLLEAVKNGDDAAFEDLKRRYLPLMCSVVGNFRFSAERYGVDFDDLKQEADIALCIAARTYDASNSGVTFGGYAKTCVRNRLISALRRAKARCEDVVLSGDLCVRDGDSESDPVEAVISADNCRRLMGLSAKLFSDYETDVFFLYLEGNKTSEIAALLGRGVRSVENALFRIRTKLGRML